MPGDRPELPAEQPGQPAGEGQAQAHAAALARGLGDVDVEDPLELALRDPRALVLDRV